MKAEQSLSAIFRQLRPAVRQSLSGQSRFRPTLQIAALHQCTHRSTLNPLQHHFSSFSPRNRFNSTSSAVSPSSPSTHSTDESSSAREEPEYQITFTCKPCLHRSTHRISQRGYQTGTVLVTCPSCKNRHLIADHLKFFADKSVTIEDLMREKNQLVKRGRLGGDLEFWDDGTKSESAQT
ncbi:hypothetical protein ACLMJK_008035 [Lecanora helva]